MHQQWRKAAAGCGDLEQTTITRGVYSFLLLSALCAVLSLSTVNVLNLSLSDLGSPLAKQMRRSISLSSGVEKKTKNKGKNSNAVNHRRVPRRLDRDAPFYHGAGCKTHPFRLLYIQSGVWGEARKIAYLALQRLRKMASGTRGGRRKQQTQPG